jgi:N-acetylmuramoyl-L-alanine amidase
MTAPPVQTKVKFKLRNRLHKVDNIGNAQVQFLDATATVVLSGVTNGHGVVELNLSSLADGDYSCAMTAPNTDSNPVGPALPTGVPVPDRIYRPVTLTVKITGHTIKTATPDDALAANVAVSGTLVVVDIQPVWMRSPNHQSRGGREISAIIVHHTACDLSSAVNTFLAAASEVSPHYMIDTDGQIIKWVQDSIAANHAGFSRWAGVNGINPVSIGIEIVHNNGPYPEAQYTALFGLLDRLTNAFSTIDLWNIVGHSDIGTNPNGRLGRKSGDPGLQFEWARLENRRLGLLASSGGTLDLSMYGGFFQSFPNGSLHLGDNDSHHRFGGAIHNDIGGSPIRELQTDLATIGYSVGTPDGDFGEKANQAILVFQEHFFAGGRGPAPSGRVDLQTAVLLKSVVAREAVRSSHLGDFPVLTSNIA